MPPPCNRDIMRRLDQMDMQLTMLNAKVQAILTLITSIKKEEDLMAGELQALQQAVAGESSVIASAITLLQGLKGALDAAIAANNPQALVDLSNQIGSETTALANAVAANTPVGP